MSDSFHRLLGAVAALLALTVVAPAAAQNAARPSIDFGQHFDVRLHHQTDSSQDPPEGQSILYVAATVLDARGDMTIDLAQRGRSVISFRCAVRRSSRTNCRSEPFDSDRLDPSLDAEVRITSVDEVTDAETVLYAGTLPVYQFWDWSGNRNNRPMHAEQRAFRLDSTLGIAFASQASFGTSTSAQGETVTASYVRFAYWDARNQQGNARLTMRCKVGDGEWQGFRLSGPSTEGDDQRVVNRVWGRDNRVHEGEDESIYYQQWVFTAEMPFIVPGAERRLSSPPPAGNGHWTCQLRDADRRVVRELQFDVRGNELVPHAAQAELSTRPGTAVVAVGFDPANLPVSFDPAEVRRGFFGMRWSSPEVAPVVGELPSGVIEPSLTAPRGARPARRRGRR